jgi:predicted lipoprotein with Yx(FWY)xxD motif
MVVFLAVASVGAAACSSGDDDEPASTGASTTGAGTSTQATTSQTSAAETTVVETTTAETTAASSTTTTASSTTVSTSSAVEALEVALNEDALGSYLVGPDGHTLYVFLRDAPDTVNCTDEGNCLAVWPPLLVEDGQEVEAGDGIDGEFDSVETPSGLHVTYNQTPLYYYAADAAAGETAGNLIGNVWFVARPDTASTAVVVANGSGGDAFLVGPTGLTLYTFDNDTEGVSNCSGQCLVNWPALTTPANLPPMGDGAGGVLATITRDDGTVQVTYDGLPLYYYVGDAVPGDKTGDGVGGVWHIATP